MIDDMTFDLIIPDSLWAVRFDDEEDNAFYQVFDRWSDPIVDADGFIDFLQTSNG